MQSGAFRLQIGIKSGTKQEMSGNILCPINTEKRVEDLSVVYRIKPHVCSWFVTGCWMGVNWGRAESCVSNFTSPSLFFPYFYHFFSGILFHYFSFNFKGGVSYLCDPYISKPMQEKQGTKQSQKFGKFNL